MKKSLQEKSNIVAKPSKEFVKTASCSYKTRILIDLEDTVGGATLYWELDLEEVPHGVKSLGIKIPKQIMTIHYFDEDLTPQIRPLELSTDDVQVNMYPDQKAIIPSSLDIRKRPFQLYMSQD